MILSVKGALTAAANTLSFTFTPNDDLTDRVCALRVHQASLNSSVTPIPEAYALIRCSSWTQPRSVNLATQSLNDVLYILHHSYPTEGPTLPVYIPPGEQKITITVENLGTANYELVMLLSLV